MRPEGIDVVRLTAMSGRAALRRGRLAEARSTLERARDLAGQVIDGHLVLPLHRDLAEVRLRLGDPADAVALADEVLTRPWGDGDSAYLLPLLAVAAAAAADAAVGARTERRPDAAAQWAATAARLAADAEDRDASGFLLPPALLALDTARAEAARALGRPVADAWAGIARGLLVRDDRYQAGWALLREAEEHLRARRRARAAATIGAARRLAADLGAACLDAAGEALARRAGSPEAASARPAGSGPYGLSPRELDVLGLLVRGRTDRQIGAELFISHRTVERHVSSLLAKLDARTRAEATALAHREGLTAVE